MQNSAQSNCTYRNSWSTLRVCPYLPLFKWRLCCIRYYVVDFWLEALTEHQPFCTEVTPAGLQARGEKNNEINNTGTVQQGTQPSLFLSLQRTRRCQCLTKTPSSLCCAWITMPICPSVGIKPPGVRTLFLVSMSFSYLCTHSLIHTHLHAFCMIMFT